MLTRDIPERGLRAGDIGTVVQVYCGDEVEVEFLRASGETHALLTLSFGDIRKMDSGDMVTTRRLAEVKLSN
mgnify:CR=1 FL=1